MVLVLRLDAGLMQTGWIDWEENRYYLNPVSDGRKGALLTGTFADGSDMPERYFKGTFKDGSIYNGELIFYHEGERIARRVVDGVFQ